MTFLVTGNNNEMRLIHVMEPETQTLYEVVLEAALEHVPSITSSSPRSPDSALFHYRAEVRIQCAGLTQPATFHYRDHLLNRSVPHSLENPVHSCYDRVKGGLRCKDH